MTRIDSWLRTLWKGEYSVGIETKSLPSAERWYTFNGKASQEQKDLLAVYFGPELNSIEGHCMSGYRTLPAVFLILEKNPGGYWEREGESWGSAEDYHKILGWTQRLRANSGQILPGDELQPCHDVPFLFLLVILVPSH